MANKRIVTLGIFLGVAWLFMLGRVFLVQVLQASDYRAIANSQSIRRDILQPRRGEILDARRNRLVINANLTVPAEGKGRSWSLNRVCPNGAMAGQVIGNVGRDGFGQSGLEYTFDKALRGSDGWQYARHDVRNRFYPGFESQAEDAVNGCDVQLTLDTHLQAVVEQALERGVLRVGAKQGTAIVVDPNTGDLLAIANYPFYNPNARDPAVGESWKNQAVVKVYEPGSTFKAITASALLEEKRITTHDKIFAENGSYSLSGQLIRDTHPHGEITFMEAMAYSSNICFAKVGTRIPPSTFYRYLRSFGFGMKSGIGLPAEESGSIKPVADWSGRTQATVSFGHEISVTPLQMTMAFAAIANGGILMRPRIVKELVGANGQVLESLPPRSVRRVISEATAATVRSMLKAVIDSGTAMEIRHPFLTMAGKTGTAQKIDPETGHYIEGSFNSSFIGMAPAEAPKMVCLVLIDEPSLFKYGGQSAAPIFREIIDRFLVEPGSPLEGLAAPEMLVHQNQTSHGMDQATSPNLLNAVVVQTQDSITTPDVRGLSTVQALQKLQTTGLIPEVLGNGSRILSQAPAPGLRLAKGERLSITAGEIRPNAMPDLLNCTLRDALQRLRDLGVEVEWQGSGRVLRQLPSAGEVLRPGQRCVLSLGWMG